MSVACRACLQRVTALDAISLFQIYKQKYKLVDILKQMIYVKIEFDDDESSNLSKIICESCANQLVSFYNFAEMVIISDQKLHESMFEPTFVDGKVLQDPNVTYEIRNEQHTVFLNMPVGGNELIEEMTDNDENTCGEDDFDGDDAAARGSPNDYKKVEEINMSGRPRRMTTNINPKYKNCNDEIDGDSNSFIDGTQLNVVDASFQCPSCNAIFQNTRGLHKHQTNIHSKISLQCELCPKIYKNRDNLTKHKNKMHPNWRSILPPIKIEYKCKEVDCNKKFPSLTLISAHHRKEHATRPRRAAIKKIEFRQRRLSQCLRLHMCKEDNCKQKFTSLKKLRLHRRISGHHSLGRKFKCSTCAAILSSPDEYANHRQHHIDNTSNANFKCVECLKEFDELRSLLRHCTIYRHLLNDNYQHTKCTVCLKNYQDIYSLMRHVRHKHPNHLNYPELRLLRDNEWKCQWCNEKFVQYEAYLLHRRMHIESQSIDDNPNEYFCIGCAKQFSDFEQLLRHCNKFQHELNKIYKQPSFKCSLCNRHYQSEKSLRRHMRLQHANSERAADRVDGVISKYSNKVKIEPHSTSSTVRSNETYENVYDRNDDNIVEMSKPSIQLLTGQEGTSVAETELTSNAVKTDANIASDHGNCYTEISDNNADINEGVKTNVNNSLFECSICNTSYQAARYLQKHTTNVHSTIWLKCELCPKEFKNRDNLTKHKNKMHPNWRVKLNDPKYQWTGENRWECGTCNETFRTRKLRTAHYHNLKHSTRDPSKCIRDFICEYCNKIFKTRRKIRMHFATHFNQKCLCNECGLIFSWPQNLILHQKRVHLKIPAAKKFKCSFCFKLFAHKHQMREHENRHKNIRNVICQYCPATFVTKAGLRAHVAQVHIGIRRHVCPICSKGFQIKGNLTAHMFVHSGTKPHHCPNCNQGFVRKYKMIHHLKSCKQIPQDENNDSME